jgi:hypothetical protein
MRAPLPSGNTWWKRLADVIGDAFAVLIRWIGMLLDVISHWR